MDLSERQGTLAVRHPWETARAAFLLDVLADLLPSPGLRVLDTGSGDAWFAQQLIAHSDDVDVVCWDLHYQEQDLVRLRSLRLLPTREAPAGPFDLGLLLDVIEHVDDDVGFVRDVVARIRPGGRVLVSVPAWPALFSGHDRALHHHRRYTPAACRRVLESAGLHIDQSGGFFHGLLLPRAASVVVERLLRRRGDPGIGHWHGGPLLTRAIHLALRAEQKLSVAAARRSVEVPGLSFFALGTRPPETSTA